MPVKYGFITDLANVVAHQIDESLIHEYDSVVFRNDVEAIFEAIGPGETTGLGFEGKLAIFLKGDVIQYTAHRYEVAI